MTFEHRKQCEKHPDEPVQYCSLCLREVRLETREECAALTQKMRAYREAILGERARDDKDENIP